MSAQLLLALVGIAVFDSLNPSLFIAQLYLLATPRPLARVLAYIAGIVSANYLGGLLVLGGMRALVGALVAQVDPAWWRGAELLAGVALIGFGLWMKLEKAAHGQARQPRSLRPGHAFLLGAAVMVNELTTALPYFVAIERLAHASLSPLQNALGLLLYNAVFALPLLGLLAGYIAARRRFVAQIERINAGMAVWVPRMIKYGSLVFGVALALDAALFFLVGQALTG